ncbi:MAG: AMIN domain-containing protein, partial [Selenomonas sp.]|nr:AMIN domain-containing protein [Selenomonas sp.]
MRRILFLAYMAALCLLLPLATAAAAESDFGERINGMAEVTGLRESSDGDKTRIVIDATREVTYKKMVLSSPDRVVVDIANAWLSPEVKRSIDIDNTFVGKVKIAQFDPKTVRVVVETKVGQNNYQVFTLNSGSVPGRVVMDFGNLENSDDVKIDWSKKTTEPIEPQPEQEKPMPRAGG